MLHHKPLSPVQWRLGKRCRDVARAEARSLWHKLHGLLSKQQLQKCQKALIQQLLNLIIRGRKKNQTKTKHRRHVTWKTDDLCQLYVAMALEILNNFFFPPQAARCQTYIENDAINDHIYVAYPNQQSNATTEWILLSTFHFAFD